MSDIHIRLCPPAALSSRDWDDIWHLTDLYYDTLRSDAEAHLRSFGEIALIYSGQGEAAVLVGMTAVDVMVTRFEERDVVAIFTSQGLLAPPWRGRNLLQSVGLRVFLRVRRQFLFNPVYWFFDTFSYRSYLLLSRNFIDYWPRHDRLTPPRECLLMDQLARERYGEAWDTASGVVRRSPQRRLRQGVATLEGARDWQNNPVLQFFVEANPGHKQGDMLVCLCPLTLKNWAVLAWHALRRSVRRMFQAGS